MFARWEEFDQEEKNWLLPAARMKVRKPSSTAFSLEAGQHIAAALVTDD
jgi:hypothetical protein